MLVPMCNEEISKVICEPLPTVDKLVRSNAIRRSISCESRPIPELNYCSVYDVVEYQLRKSDKFSSETEQYASYWVDALATLDDCDDFSDEPALDQAVKIVEVISAEGQVPIDEKSIAIALALLALRQRSMEVCFKSDC